MPEHRQSPIEKSAMLRALLIDDEPDARADLRQLLSAHATDLAIIGEAETMDDAEAALARPDYDLVFLDVQLRGGTAFDLVPRIRRDARIVFVTAHDAYAVRAFEVNALDYLLKPINPERLAEAVARSVAAFAFGGAGRPDAEQDEEAVQVPLRSDDIVFLRTGMHGRFVALPELSVIEAEQNYVAVRLADGTKHLVRRTMKSWTDLLPASHFMRVHRTAIVNLQRITRYERDRDERTLLHMQGVGEPIAATRKVWPELQAKLEQLRRVV
jgi:two-component system LytT family response regulator